MVYGGLKTTTQRGTATPIIPCKSCLDDQNAFGLEKSQYKPALQRSSSMNSSRTTNLSPTVLDNSLQLILDKLHGLDEVNNQLMEIEESVPQISRIKTAMSSMQKQVDVWSKKLKVLEEIHAFTLRIRDNKAGLANVRAKQRAVRLVIDFNTVTGITTEV